MNRKVLNYLVGAVLVIIAALMLFVFQVRQSEVAVVTTFGKLSRSEGPGPHLRWPWPIEKVYKIDERIQNFQDRFTEDYTGDNNTLLTSVYVGWRITNAIEFFPRFANGSIDVAQKQLEDIVGTAKSSIVGKHPLADFVNPDPKELKLDQIETQIESLVQSQLVSNDYGIEINFLGIKRMGLPQSVSQAVFTRITSDRNVLSSQYENQGEAEAQKIKSAANRQAAEMIADARGEARRIQGEGEAEAARILPVFQKNPQLADFLLRIDAIQKSLKENSSLIFDERTPPFDLFRGSLTNAFTQ